MVDALGSRVRRALVEAMRFLHARGLVNLRGGNASARLVLPDGTSFIYITPGGVAKPVMGEEDVAVMGLEGGVVAGRPSSEYRLHLEVYRRRGDVYAVVHAHCPLAVAVAEAGLAEQLLSVGYEARYYIGGCIGVVPPLEPGSQELAVEAARRLEECNVAVLRRHGAVAVGVSRDPVEAVYEAVDRLEALEDSARILVAERIIGGRGLEG